MKSDDGLTLTGKARKLRVDFDSSNEAHREAHYLAKMYLRRLDAKFVHWLRLLAECCAEEQMLEEVERAAQGAQKGPH